MKLEIRNLSFSYGSAKVLNGLSLSAGDGELLSILGANGAGKSTLFKCILGLLATYSGEILIDGKSTKAMSIREIAKNIAYIPQSCSPAFNFSVRDIVLMGTTAGMGILKMPGKEEAARVDAALKKIGIQHLRTRCFHHLSGGERQLVIIARALVQNSKILLLDEPTASLDYGNQMLVLRQIKKLSREGYTVFQTTHNPEHSYMFSDKIAALKDGQILACGTPEDVIREDIMSELYGLDIKIASLETDKLRVCLPRETEGI